MFYECVHAHFEGMLTINPQFNEVLSICQKIYIVQMKITLTLLVTRTRTPDTI